MTDAPNDRQPGSPSSSPSGITTANNTMRFNFLNVFNSRSRSPSFAPGQPTSALTTSHELHKFLYTSGITDGEDAQTVLASAASSALIRVNFNADAFIDELSQARSPEAILKLISDIIPLVRTHPVEKINELWTAGSLTLMSITGDQRGTAWTLLLRFMLACLHGRLDIFSGVERASCYRIISHNDGRPNDDLELRLNALKTLTNNGRNCAGLEKNACRLVSSWLVLAFERKEDRTLLQIFTLLRDMIKFNFSLLEELDVTHIINEISAIAFSISSIDDMRSTLECFKSIVRFGYVPNEALGLFVEIVCRVRYVEECQDLGETIIMSLLQSHVKFTTVLRLLQVFDDKENLKQRALPIAAITHLSRICTDRDFKYLNLPIASVFEALRKSLKSLRVDVQNHSLSTLVHILEEKRTSITYDEWNIVMDIIDDLTDKVLHDISVLPTEFWTLSHAIQDEENIDERLIYEYFGRIIQILQEKFMNSSYFGSTKRFINILGRLHEILPVETKLFLIKYYDTEHLCRPSEAEWIKNITLLIDYFYPAFANPPNVRLRVLELVSKIYDDGKDDFADVLAKRILIPIFSTLPDESESSIFGPLLNLVENVALEATDERFPEYISILCQCIGCKCKQPMTRSHRRSSSSASQSVHNTPFSSVPPGVKSPVNENHSMFMTEPFLNTCKSTQASIVLINIFQDVLYRHPTHCNQVFSRLLEILATVSNHVHVRLYVLRLLVRLRVDADHRLYITNGADAKSTAELLGRLKVEDTSLQDTGPEIQNPDRKINTSSFSPEQQSSPHQDRHCLQSSVKNNPTMEGNEALSYQMSFWSVPESLPFKIRQERPSLYVFSYDENMESGMTKEKRASDVSILPIGEYIGAIVRLLFKEREWDIYSYVLAYLPLQLANKHLFCACCTEIQELRKCILDLVNNGRTPENLPIPTDIKRERFPVIVYRILSLLIAYRRFFQKKDHDDFIMAFEKGLQPRSMSAKPCIHALNVCAYELPMSLTKFMPRILQKFSQIITSSSLSVHILEFLSGLARLRNLYVNFTEDDFKRVFGIAVQYIQFTTNQSRSMEGTMSSYVFIMAYHVIAIFFISLRQSERRKYVSYITRQLIVANEKNAELDEPTLVCLDMLNRYAYSNARPKPERSEVGALLIGNLEETKSKTWIVGTSFVTVRIAKTTGWAEVVIRRSSGSSQWLCKLDNFMLSRSIVDENADILDDKTLPATLMLHRPDDVDMEVEQDTLSSIITSTKEGDTSFKSSTSSIPTSSSLSGIRSIRGYLSASLSQESSRAGFSLSSASGRLRSSSVTHNSKNTPIVTGLSALDDIHAHTASETSTAHSILEESSSKKITSSYNRDDTLFESPYLFLQMNGKPEHIDGLPIALPDDQSTQRALNCLDQTPVVDFHKIGVLYVGRDQKTEKEILGNLHGSQDYMRMVSSLGEIVRLKGCKNVYTGGLDREMDLDGKYAVTWSDNVTQLIFHVATLMPTNLQLDPHLNNKKRHIGNDFVRIVYNDSGNDYEFNTVSGQFNFINIVVSPHSDNPATSIFKESADHAFFKVSMQRRSDMPDIGPLSDFKLISSIALPSFVKMMAMHANIFAQVWLQTHGVHRVQSAGGAGTVSSGTGTVEYVSNWRDRLRQIKRVRDRILKEKNIDEEGRTREKAQDIESLWDFTRYT